MFKHGDVVVYYPRAGKPGHRVTVLEVRPHPFHGSIVRFRSPDGRAREVTIGRFHTEPGPEADAR